MMVVEGTEFDDEAFEAHIAPLREALADLLDESDQLKEKAGSIASADSPAMAELAAEDEFKGRSPWGQDPVQAAHNQAQLLLIAGTDCARAAIRLLSSEPTPVYSHAVLARAVLEQAGRAWWLLAPAIGFRLRVARGMNERIFSLVQQTRLPLEADEADRPHDRLKALISEAELLGFRRVNDDPPYLEEVRPGQTELITRLLSVGDDKTLGRFIYGLFSAVAHGTAFGLTSSVTTDAPGMPRIPGVTWGTVYTGSRDVLVVLSAIAIGVAEAFRRRNKFFGWESESWSLASLRALDAARTSLPSQ